MKFVQWIADKYSVKILKIDEQHQILIGIINEVFEAKTNDLGNAVIAGILERMSEYAETHFKYEEELMKENGYPKLEQHRMEHQFFITSVGAFNRDFKLNEESLTGEMLDFLKNWLIKHIMETDQKYGPFLNERGIR